MTKIIRGFNPVRNGYGIELMVEAEGVGVVPYYTTPDFKPGTYEEEIYNNTIAGVYGTIATYSPPPEQKKKAIADMVQAHLDATAQVYGFDDIRNAVSYADEPAVPSFQTHGLALRAWRSLVWQKCYAVLAQVEAGEIVEPSGAELMAMLPTLNIGV